MCGEKIPEVRSAKPTTTFFGERMKVFWPARTLLAVREAAEGTLTL